MNFLLQIINMQDLKSIFESDSKPAILFRDSKDPTTFNCPNITGDQFLSSSIEPYPKPTIIPNPKTSIIITEKFTKLKAVIVQSRQNFVRKTCALLKDIRLKADFSLRKLKDLEQECNEYLKVIPHVQEIKDSSDCNMLETLLKLTPDKASSKDLTFSFSFQFDIRKLRSKFEKLTNIPEINDVFRLDIDTISSQSNYKYIRFTRNGPNRALETLDVISGNITQLDIGVPFCDNLNPICLLSDKSVFCYTSQESFIVDKNDNLKSLGSHNYGLHLGIILIGNSVFLFGGSLNNTVKYELDNDKWISLTEYPLNNHVYLTCAMMKHFVMIVGYSHSDLVLYHIHSNTYSTLDINLNVSESKSCLVYDRKAYIIEHSTNLHESETDNLYE